MFKASTFDKLLDKATSLNNLEPDWNSILQICDSIRQNDVQPKYALSAIKKKLNAPNPNVELMALQVLESCIKNCGSIFHVEVASRSFMEDFHDILRATGDRKVREEMLRLVQAWAHAFRNEPTYKSVQDQIRLMKHEGYQFPVFKESDAMFDADTAPEWADGEVCHRCRAMFSMVLRKHHCRNCGQVFCAKCTAKNSPIPKYGIEKEVRVCDVCYDKLNKKTEPKTIVDSSKKAASATPKTVKKNEQEELKKLQAQEEEELALALALSKSEAESKEIEAKGRGYHLKSGGANSTLNSTSANAKVKKSSKSSKSSRHSSRSSTKSETVSSTVETEDPELSRYLNRDYWEQRSAGVVGDYEHAPSPSAPQPTSIIANKVITVDNSETQKIPLKDCQANGVLPEDKSEDELMQFTNNLRSTIEIFMNRLNSNKLRGRPITNDHGLQSMFLNLTNQHANLVGYVRQTNEDRTNCERLQDKISQIRDARAALDALREEHREQLRREAEEADRVRQQQMAQKLEILRKKKHEYQQYQQQLAIQRMQEQEREIMMKSEQFKFAGSGQWTQMPPTSVNYSAIPPGGVPQGGIPAHMNVGGVPAHMNYYTGYPGQQIMTNMPSQPLATNSPGVHELKGHSYVQSALPEGSNMVAIHQAPVANPTMSVQHQPPMAIPQQMPPIQLHQPQYVHPAAGQQSAYIQPSIPNQYIYSSAQPSDFAPNIQSSAPIPQQTQPREEEPLIVFE